MTLSRWDELQRKEQPGHARRVSGRTAAGGGLAVCAFRDIPATSFRDQPGTTLCLTPAASHRKTWPPGRLPDMAFSMHGDLQRAY